MKVCLGPPCPLRQQPIFSIHFKTPLPLSLKSKSNKSVFQRERRQRKEIGFCQACPRALNLRISVGVLRAPLIRGAPSAPVEGAECVLSVCHDGGPQREVESFVTLGCLARRVSRKRGHALGRNEWRIKDSPPPPPVRHKWIEIHGDTVDDVLVPLGVFGRQSGREIWKQVFEHL